MTLSDFLRRLEATKTAQKQRQRKKKQKAKKLRQMAAASRKANRS